MKIPVTVARGKDRLDKSLSLGKAWRVSDISWRESMYQIPPEPGYWAPEVDDDRRRALGIPDDALALGVKWVPDGKPAQAAGLRKGMVIVAVDGSRKRRTVGQVQLYIRTRKNPGDTVEFTVLDVSKERTLRLRF